MSNIGIKLLKIGLWVLVIIAVVYLNFIVVAMC